jgi:hypothetical protein
MAVSSCQRQSFGFDDKRLRFLYSSAVKPIFTYGCSVWVSFLKTKAGTKKVRSFQRTICRFIICAFKTAPTESLILLSNLLPLDLRVLEISTLRLLSSSTDLCFSKSSRNFISQRLPFVSKGYTLSRTSLPSLTNYPPWRILLYNSPIFSTVVPLHPLVPSTLHCFICVYHKRRIAGFCVVFTDWCAVLDILNLSLPPSISARTAMSLAFSATLERVSEFRQSFSACDIFVSEMLEIRTTSHFAQFDRSEQPHPATGIWKFLSCFYGHKWSISGSCFGSTLGSIPLSTHYFIRAFLFKPCKAYDQVEGMEHLE